MTDSSSRCKYFVKRKNRFCRMTVREGNQFCGEHMTNDNNDTGNRRVKCPWDPTHTCYESRLKKHRNVCNAKRRLDAQPAFVVKEVNLDHEAIKAPSHVPLSQLDKAVLDTVINKIQSAYENLPEISQAILQHDLLKDEFETRRKNDKTYGRNVIKHLLQDASLLGHLERAGLVRDDTCFIEFGAGRGELAYLLGQIIKNRCSNSCVLLVDRSSHRHKKDNKLKRNLSIKRVRADIADLQLNQIAEIQSVKYKVGIAKHLCGTATDLAIRCLLRSINSEPKVDVRGLVLAVCCHHKCEYLSYVGRDYLQQCGFTTDEFPILCRVTSWATCGFSSKNDANRQSDSTVRQHDKNVTDQFSKLDEREILGRKAKVLLNWGRLVFLRSVGFQAELLYYASTDTTLENMCIVATREHIPS